MNNRRSTALTRASLGLALLGALPSTALAQQPGPARHAALVVTVNGAAPSFRCLEIRENHEGRAGLWGHYDRWTADGRPNRSSFRIEFVDGQTPMLSMRQEDGGYRALYVARLVGPDRFDGMFLDGSGASGRVDVDFGQANRCQPVVAPVPAPAPPQGYIPPPPPAAPQGYVPAPAPYVAPAPVRQSVDRRAGPLWNQADAAQKCPAVCGGAANWTGQWRTIEAGRMSVCGCYETVAPGGGQYPYRQ